MVSTPLKKYDCSQNGESSSNNRGGENKKLWNHHPGTFHLTQNIWTKHAPFLAQANFHCLSFWTKTSGCFRSILTILASEEMGFKWENLLGLDETCFFFRKTNMKMETPAKWMVGRWNLFLGPTAYFHVRTASFRKCKLNVYHMFETHPYKRTMCPAKNFSRTIKTIRSDKNVEDRKKHTHPT